MSKPQEEQVRAAFQLSRGEYVRAVRYYLRKSYLVSWVQVLGLVSDVLNSDGTVSDSQVELAQEIVEETGADYQHLVPSSDMFGLLSQIYGVPTTFFVDSEGYQVGYAYVSALSRDQFVTIIEDALAEVEQ